MTTQVIRFIMLALNILILICIVFGFFSLKRYIKTNEETEVKKENIKKITTITGFLIAGLSFVVLAIGVAQKIL